MEVGHDSLGQVAGEQPKLCILSTWWQTAMHLPAIYFGWTVFLLQVHGASSRHVKEAVELIS